MEKLNYIASLRAHEKASLFIQIKIYVKRTHTYINVANIVKGIITLLLKYMADELVDNRVKYHQFKFMVDTYNY